MLGDDRVELKRKPTRRTLSPGCASAASGAVSTAPRPVTKARRFSNPIDPPRCEGPVEAARPTAHASRLAPAGAGRGSAPPGTSPSTPAAGPSMAVHSLVPGTAEMLRHGPPEAHVRLVPGLRGRSRASGHG